MFEKFGEFDSAEEINRAAAAQLAEGDTEAVIVIAKENGIERLEAEDYIDGINTELVTPLMAALGKLKVEQEEYEIGGILEDWVQQVQSLCIKEEQMCIAVRKKGKSLRDCMARLIAFAFENKVQVSDKIAKATKVNHNGKMELMQTPLYLGVPNKKMVDFIIKQYYLGEADKC